MGPLFQGHLGHWSYIGPSPSFYGNYLSQLNVTKFCPFDRAPADKLADMIFFILSVCWMLFGQCFISLTYIMLFNKQTTIFGAKPPKLVGELLYFPLLSNCTWTCLFATHHYTLPTTPIVLGYYFMYLSISMYSYAWASPLYYLYTMPGLLIGPLYSSGASSTRRRWILLSLFASRYDLV